MLVADIDRWLSARWAWVRPRTVPLLAAFLGLLVTLGAVKYVAVFAYQEDLALDVHSRTSRMRPPPPLGCGAREPVQIIVAPIAHGDPYIELMIDVESR